MTRQPRPRSVPWDRAAVIWVLMVLGRVLAWDYTRRARWANWLQVRNLKVRNRVINTLADVTGEKQLKIL